MRVLPSVPAPRIEGAAVRSVCHVPHLIVISRVRAVCCWLWRKTAWNSFVYKRALKDDAVPSERLRLACEAYLDFSAEKPQLYRQIFVSNADLLDKLREEVAPDSAFGLFERLVADSLELKDEQSTGVAALASWSIIHGFAMLRMNGRLDSVTNIESVEHAVLARACN
jgi:hypothetical protein